MSTPALSPLAAADPHTPAPTPPPSAPPVLGAWGPSSAAGKAIAARNATTHGLFARDIVLPDLGEDPAAFDALLARLIEQLPPRNLLERHYLEQIAAASWRLRRLHRWQAQIYEDETLTEDQRLDKLDKTLRHETTLTRQIDRAVRTLNRDLKWLFEGRAKDEAHYQRDLTPDEVRQEPELGIEVQRDIWRRLRPANDADLADAPLDNTAAAAPEACGTENCENEPPADGGRDRGLSDGGGTPDARAHKKCENEPPPPAPNPADLILLGSQLPGGRKRPRFW